MLPLSRRSARYSQLVIRKSVTFFPARLRCALVFYRKRALTTLEVSSSMKALVVYYSRTGNTKSVAEEIAAELGADVDEVVDLKKREGRMGYLSASIDATSNRETNISETKKNPADYDLIVIGTPVWFYSPSSAIRTYIAKHDVSGKNVALFFTCNGGPGGVVEKTKNLMPNAVFMGELILAKPSQNKNETKKKIVEWCTTLRR